MTTDGAAARSKNHDPRDIFSNACDWMLASQMLVDAVVEQGARQVVVPGVLCRAFATELLLKSLVTIDTGGTPWGHELKDLFELTSQDSKAWIRRYYDAHCEGDRRAYEDSIARGARITEPFSLDWALATSSECFTTMRYGYEWASDISIPSGHGWTANVLPEAVLARILEIRPDWKSLVAASTVPVALLGGAIRKNPLSNFV